MFAREQDVDPILTILEAMGCRTAHVPALAGQGLPGEDYVDVIYGGGSGVATVDEEWFEHAVEAKCWART
jgi:hypothetical protein